jgi:pimeloyl-ACP methyl ester carboxylesterase
MERIEFSSEGERRLVGLLTHFDGPQAVVMVHGLLSDKDANGLFPVVSQELRKRRWASLRFDMSGNGESDDHPLTSEAAREDLRAAVGLMRSIGYQRIALWGHGLGSRFCVGQSDGVATMVLTDPLLDRVRPNWRLLFTPTELAALSREGRTLRTRKSPRPTWQKPPDGFRRQHLVDRELLDLHAMYEPERELPRVRCPVLVVQAGAGRRVSAQTKPLMAYLPRYSKVVTVDLADAAAPPPSERIAELGAMWLDRFRHRRDLASMGPQSID